MKSATIKLAFLAAVAAAVAVVSGCDAQENADTDNGRLVFTAQCGNCHILAEAGTTAKVGPDLDAAFAAAREAGMDNDTIEGIVESQIEIPRATDPQDPTYMPPKLVEGDEARDVAAYVASVAGVPGIMPPVAPGGEGGQVFANNGCGSCHVLAAAQSNGQVGPNLDEVLPGQSTAMIEQSIVDPSANIAAGFNDGIMPASYGTDISPADLKLLVNFLADSAGKSGGSSGGGSGLLRRLGRTGGACVVTLAERLPEPPVGGPCRGRRKQQRHRYPCRSAAELCCDHDDSDRDDDDHHQSESVGLGAERVAEPAAAVAVHVGALDRIVILRGRPGVRLADRLLAHPHIFAGPPPRQARRRARLRRRRWPRPPAPQRAARSRG